MFNSCWNSDNFFVFNRDWDPRHWFPLQLKGLCDRTKFDINYQVRCFFSQIKTCLLQPMHFMVVWNEVIYNHKLITIWWIATNQTYLLIKSIGVALETKILINLIYSFNKLYSIFLQFSSRYSMTNLDI